MVKLYAIIRIRGQPDVSPDVKHTLKLLRLHKRYHMVIYPDTLPGIKGMLQKVKDWVTWGEIDYETLVEVLKKRGRLVGNKPLDDEVLDKYLEKYGVKGGIEALAKALLDGKVMLHKLGFIKPVFRLAPPKGGFKKSIRRPYNDGGELGYRGSDINKLIKKMI